MEIYNISNNILTDRVHFAENWHNDWSVYPFSYGQKRWWRFFNGYKPLVEELIVKWSAITGSPFDIIRCYEKKATIGETYTSVGDNLSLTHPNYKRPKALGEFYTETYEENFSAGGGRVSAGTVEKSFIEVSEPFFLVCFYENEAPIGKTVLFIINGRAYFAA